MSGRPARLAWLSVALLPPVAIILVGPDRLVGHDVAVFFKESGWIAGGPALYSDQFSEYPLVANLLFAAFRVIADALPLDVTRLGAFSLAWMTVAWWLWLAVLAAIAKEGRRGAIWLWLTPASIYFSVLHFDIGPVACTLAALVMARGGRLRWAALLLGIAIALKGYAIFAVPAFAVWILLAQGRREAVVAAALAVAPLAVSVGVVALAAGSEAALLPFRWQAMRGPNGQGLWDALGMLTGGGAVDLALEVRWLPLALTVTASLGAAAMRPRTFDELCRAVTVAIGGYSLVSVFYSAQFALWVVPSIALGGGPVLLAVGIAFQWITFVYAPIGTHLPGRLAIVSQVTFLAVTVTRGIVVLVAIVPPLRHRTAARIPDTVQV